MVAAAAALLLAAPLAFSVLPDGSGLSLLGRWTVPETCAVKLSTGRDCPTCHLGRSIVALAHGDVAASRRHHPGGSWLLGWVATQLPVRLALAWRRPSAAWWVADLAFTLATLTAVILAVARGWV